MSKVSKVTIKLVVDSLKGQLGFMGLKDGKIVSISKSKIDLLKLINPIIIKRNGEKESFIFEKIIRAIEKAFNAKGVFFAISDCKIFNMFLSIHKDVANREEILIEDIQDIVEYHLMENFPVVGKAYILYRAKKNEEREYIPDNSALSEYIICSKYARYLPHEKRRETYPEIVDRVKAMHIKKFPHLSNKIDKVFYLVYSKKILPSMRSMQFAGPAIEKHNASMFNCVFTKIDRIEVFAQIFHLLLCGSGQGYSVQLHHVAKLPKVGKCDKREVVHFTINDTIEGWSIALYNLMSYAFDETFPYLEFDYSHIRPKGTPLKTKGGLAPGHVPLKECLEKVRKVILDNQGKKLRPINCYDIICFIAEAVLSGGIRRSATICLFSLEDDEMMHAKSPENFVPFQKNDQRQMSNNSAVLDRKKIKENEFRELVRLAQKNYGEPGFFFTSDVEYGTNPCAEIGLDCNLKFYDKTLTGFAFCNLTEVNVAAIRSPEEFLECVKAASFLGTLQAAYTDFDFLAKTTQGRVKNISKIIADRDANLGVGLMGIMSNPKIGLDKKLLYAGADAAVKENRKTAALIGINPAARVTTVKPGGTAPKAASTEDCWVSSGITPEHSKRYFRRVTAKPNEAPAKYFKSINPHMVEEKPNGDWSLIFPILPPENCITIDELSAEDHFKHYLTLMEYWIIPGTTERSKAISPGLNHNVSITICADENEIEMLIDLIWKYKEYVSALSFAPRTLDSTFPFAPNQSVRTIEDGIKWKALISQYKKVDWSQMREEIDGTNLLGEQACSGGKCELD